MSGIEAGRGKLEKARSQYEDGLVKLQGGQDRFSEKNELAQRQKEVKAATLDAARTALQSVLDTRGTLETLVELLKEGESIYAAIESKACQAEDSFTEAEILARRAGDLVGEQKYTTPPIEGSCLLKEAAATSVMTNNRAGSFCFSGRQTATEIDLGLAEIATLLTTMVDGIPSHDKVTSRDKREMSQYNEYTVDASSAFTEAIVAIDQQLDIL